MQRDENPVMLLRSRRRLLNLAGAPAVGRACSITQDAARHEPGVHIHGTNSSAQQT